MTNSNPAHSRILVENNRKDAINPAYYVVTLYKTPSVQTVLRLCHRRADRITAASSSASRGSIIRINARGYSRLAYLHSSDGVIKVGRLDRRGFRCFIQCLCLGLACETRWSTLGATGRVMQLWIYGCLFSQLCLFGCCSNTSSERKKKKKCLNGK
ncbi:hypothetical protein CEXT_474731 [Caerostris extrusa]|uniref:Uncharacterized protein n=1 Tax=Caerostris extrusa TaxID=172846 RepID=A0AAV4TAX7_CAEEX|nr:hypothetical protein CEXT_474731 [Caerostris extrusa]